MKLVFMTPESKLARIRLVRAELEHAAYDVYVSSSWEDVQLILNNYQADALIVWCGRPELDQIRLSQFIDQYPTILITEQHHVDLAYQMRLHGGAYMCKPWSPHNLKIIVNRLTAQTRHDLAWLSGDEDR